MTLTASILARLQQGPATFSDIQQAVNVQSSKARGALLLRLRVLTDRGQVWPPGLRHQWYALARDANGRYLPK